MSILFILQTLFELFLVLLVVWALFNEEKLVKFEKNVMANIRRRKFKLLKSGKTYNKNIDKVSLSCYNTVC